MSAALDLLRVEEIRKSYPVRRGAFGAARGRLRAVDGVSLHVASGETLGLVGESGSGKTTTGRLIARLEEPESGRIWFDGEDWLALSGEALRRRRRDLQVVFQDPQTSLNPRMTAGDQVAEPLRVQAIVPRQQVRSRVAELLAEVGLSPESASRFPSEFSGGQRQRIAIARALATRPRLVICDEPVASLDVSVAAQVVNLLLDLRERSGLSYLFVSHDLATVERISDRVAVMYLGRIVEEGPTAEVTSRPLHPYTAALLSAVPSAGPVPARARVVLPGEPPSAADPPHGCSFHPRCPIARPRCREETPPLSPFTSSRTAACFYPGELAP
ncbi:MAG TPA: oligopeptide/dipeptide ABC transporter ATP-binding protein [Thermoanaerobaculia bacterium]|nr:oligopeptide/dipeptide ABC transporter ATP-binding protein [Thermoanaerobaculia bacterium]